jgi:hypothetical protein
MNIRKSETAPPVVPATTTPQPKMRKPPPRVRDAIELLCTGRARTITAAAAKVGLTRERLSRAFSEPHNAEALRARAAREVALSSGRAAARLNQLIDSTSQRVALEATKFSLGVAGIKPASDAVSVNVGLELRAGYVIDLRDRADRGPLPEPSWSTPSRSSRPTSSWPRCSLPAMWNEYKNLTTRNKDWAVSLNHQKQWPAS